MKDDREFLSVYLNAVKCEIFTTTLKCLSIWNIKFAFGIEHSENDNQNDEANTPELTDENRQSNILLFSCAGSVKSKIYFANGALEEDALSNVSALTQTTNNAAPAPDIVDNPDGRESSIYYLSNDSLNCSPLLTLEEESDLSLALQPAAANQGEHLIFQDLPNDSTVEAYDMLQNYLKDPTVWQRLKKFFLHDLFSHLLDSGEYYSRLGGTAELNKLLEDKNTAPFFELFRKAFNQVKKFPIADKNSNATEETLKQDHWADLETQGENENTHSPLHNASVSIAETSSSSYAIGETSGTMESIFQKLAQVIDEVFSVAEYYSCPEDAKKMISVCGKLLFNALFSMKEILAGNPTGRKKPNSEEPVEKYDSRKIITIAKFLSWIKSQPQDHSINSFRKYEALRKGKGLTPRDFKYFWDTVIVKYTSDLRNKK